MATYVVHDSRSAFSAFSKSYESDGAAPEHLPDSRGQMLEQARDDAAPSRLTARARALTK